MRRKKSIFLVAIIFIFVSFGQAESQMGEGGGHGSGHQMKHHRAHKCRHCQKGEIMGTPMMGSDMGGGMMGLPGYGMMGPGSHMMRHFSVCLQNAEKLGLSEKQLDELRKIHNEQLKKLIGIKSEIQILNVDLMGELRKNVPEFDKVESLVKKQESFRTEFVLEAIRTRIEASKILTDEQFLKLQELMRGTAGEQEEM